MFKLVELRIALLAMLQHEFPLKNGSIIDHIRNLQNHSHARGQSIFDLNI